MKPFRQTKIVATIGPASSSPAMIRKLFLAGADVFRLNFSHGAHADLRRCVDSIRALEKKMKRPIGIIADLQGPKLRIGKIEGGSLSLKKGQHLRFDLLKEPGNAKRIPLPHPEIIKTLHEGDFIYLDDGKVRVQVSGKGKAHLDVKVVSGSKLSDHKGFNVPGTLLPIPALTAKDKKDLKAALSMGVDWIAQSFVQQPGDVKHALKLIGGRAKLMVKLEKPSAVAQLAEIITLADGIMLARGDLGVEIPPEDVPSVQKQVVRAVREAGKPVIVATQMLESMIENARPTRAEASDVATAVYDGADAVMLSAETAVGRYPEQAVEMMARIARRTENDPLYQDMMERQRPDSLPGSSNAITTAAHYVAEDVGAKVIVNFTMSGSTTLRTARMRPAIPILCLTPHIHAARQLTLSYGVRSVHAPEMVEDFTGPAVHAAKFVKKYKLAAKGEPFVMTAGVPFGTPGTTNILRIAEI